MLGKHAFNDTRNGSGNAFCKVMSPFEIAFVVGNRLFADDLAPNPFTFISQKRSYSILTELCRTDDDRYFKYGVDNTEQNDQQRDHVTQLHDTSDTTKHMHTKHD